MHAATRDDLRGRRKRRYDTVDLPGGTTVRLRSLSEADRTTYEFATSDDSGRWSKKRAKQARPIMLALSIVDDSDQLLYDVDSDEDLAELREWDSRDASLVYAACLELNHAGGGEDTIEDTEKNSDAPAVCA